MASFGFSVGDFVSAIVLVRKVGKALSESRGSPNEVSSAVQLLSSVAGALEESRAIFISTETTSGLHSPSILNGIITETKICKKIIEDFMQRSRSYTDALANGQGSRAKREWKKVTWCLFHDNDIRNLQHHLQSHLLALCMYNVAHSRYVFDHPTTAMRLQIARLAAMANAKAISRMEALFESKVQRLMTGIDNLRMPRQLGWVWEGDSGPLDTPVRLFDAFGKVELIPLVFLSTPKVSNNGMGTIRGTGCANCACVFSRCFTIYSRYCTRRPQVA